MPAPANDDIGSAGAITPGSPITGTTVEATADADEQLAYGASVRTVYYSWQNTTGVTQDFVTGDFTADSPALDDGFLSLWLVEGTFPADADALMSTATNLGIVGPGEGSLGATVPDDAYVVVQIHADGGGEGSFGLAPSASPFASGSSTEEGRVLIAFDDGPLVADPTWTRIDDVDGFVVDIEITAGKQSETDESETNHAIVRLNDTTGVADPNNPASPWFGNLVGRQIMLQLYNPVEDAWFTRFRGTIKRPAYDVNPATRDGISILSNVALECVGIFDKLARKQQVPGIHGDVPPAGSESMVFWQADEVNNRMMSMLDWAGVDSSRYIVFSGNVNVIGTKYDPGDSFLVGLRDAADAETASALANIYEDRYGRFVFHGRQSRIDPDTVAAGAGTAWEFQRYKLGDGAAITGDSDFAQIRPPFRFAVPLERLINICLITPRKENDTTFFDRADIPTLVIKDDPSIAEFDEFPFNATDSINAGHKTNGDTASEDLLRTSQYLVDNYKQPQIRIEAATIMALDPDDPRATPTWNILSRADISDVVTTTVGYAGDGVGIDQDDFIEGWTQTITPLNPEHDMVVLTVNVSPVPSDASAYND